MVGTVNSVSNSGSGATIDFAVTDDWVSSFNGAMTVTGGDAALNGWTVEFDADFTITSIWNAEIVSHVGSHYVIRNAAWNGTVAADVSTAFGFQAQSGASGNGVSGYMLNGEALGAAVPPPDYGAVDFAITGDWGASFNGAITVTAGAEALKGWTVEFDADFTITSIWNAEIVSHVGNHYVIRSVAWNGNVAPDASTAFGFQALDGASNSVSGYKLNGHALSGEAPPALPTLAVSEATVVEGDDGTSHLVFTVTLSVASATAVSVSYATADGTATAGSDYTAASGTLTFAPGETSKTILVPVHGDATVEPNEALSLQLSAPTGATLGDGTGIGMIVNDDVAPVTGAGAVDFAITDDWGASFNGAMTVTGGLEALNGWTVEFDADFTITSIWNAEIVSHVGSHYVVRNVGWNASVPANASVGFGFQALDGASGNEVSGYMLNGQAVGNEPPPTLAVGDATVVEGDDGTSHLVFTVTLSAASSTAVSVSYVTADGTATAGSDYTATTGTLTFAPGETSKTILVPVHGDAAVEASETLSLQLSAPSGAAIADGSGSGTILNDDVPALAVSDATVVEGDGGTSQLVFTVTLSAASETAVSVSYATADGTATAGSDYTAATGTLTFAPGETSKMIQVAIHGDTVFEASETLSLTLSSPSGATIATGAVSGTIVNDDTDPAIPPQISIADVTVVEGTAGLGPAAAGWFSTSGNQIVDSAGNSVQIAGVNWFGMETETMAPHGLWARSYTEMMDQMADLGFNTIRLPFASEILHTTALPSGINFNLNPDLEGLTPLEIMDKIIDYAGQIGMKVILDHHRSDIGGGAAENGLWYNDDYSEEAWIADWQMLAERYANNPTVIGADLHNEPALSATWGDGGATDWARAATAAGNAIGEVNSNWLIFVEGIGSYDGQDYWWGGNLMGVRDHPIDLDVDNKLVYSVHEYPNSVWPQPWFQGEDYPANLPAKFDQMWGYIYKDGIAPIYVGEIGTMLQDPKDAPWLDAITAYLAGDFDNDGVKDIAAGDTGPSWSFWSWNPNSIGTGGIVGYDWTTVNADKMAYLQDILFKFDSDVAGGDGDPASTYALFTVSLSHAASEAVSVDFITLPGTADDQDFTPVSGTLTFAPGETSKSIAIAIDPDNLGEANERFSVMLQNAHGATISAGLATGTIHDDDGGPQPPAPPAPESGPLGDVDLSFDAISTWTGGFTGTMTVQHNGSDTHHGWEIQIDMPVEITSIWDAEIVSHEGNTYVIRNAAWNADLAPNQEVTFGFGGNGNASDLELLF